MWRAVVTLLALVLCLGSLGAALAASPPAAPEVPQLFGNFQPVPGAWSEYTVVDKHTGAKTHMRMAIVGQEGDGHWYEVLNDDGQSKNVVKMLVVGDPEDPNNIRRMILKSGDNPATEMPRDFVAMGRRMAAHMFERRSGVPAEAPPGLKAEEAGRRSVTVPAGTFSVQVHRIVDAQGKVYATYDFDPAVLPFGVVTSATEKNTMELLGHGSGATSRITETPVPLAGPPGMPTGMPRGMPPGLKEGMPAPKP